MDSDVFFEFEMTLKTVTKNMQIHKGGGQLNICSLKYVRTIGRVFKKQDLRQNHADAPYVKWVLLDVFVSLTRLA